MSGFMNFDDTKCFRLMSAIIVIAGITLYSSSCQPELSPDAIIEQRVDDLLNKMTLEEKIGQMTMVRHFDGNIENDIGEKFIGAVIHSQGPLPGENAAAWQARFVALQKKALGTRLGIPLLIGVDAVHGQNTFEGATIFPHNIGLGASGNERLVEEIAAITAIEMQATGFNWTFAPCIAIPYNEKWGRVYEAYSESTETTSKLGKAAVKGFQGDLSENTTVMATAKHYVGDGATDFGIEGGNATLSMQEISQRLLPPYRAAVNAGVGAVMVSFNSTHGIFMHAHKELITDTLKNGMGFDGMVVTDWRGYSRFGENDIINAGVDIVMAVEGDLDHFQNGLKHGVDSGYVSLDRIDDAVRRILRQKFRMGLFETPFPDSGLVEKIGIPEHREKARQAVRESLVLLKNENDALPIQKKTNKIVVIGEHANNPGLQSGGWSINWQGTLKSYAGSTTILQGIQSLAGGNVVYDEHATGNHFDADVAIIVVGETPYAETVGDIRDGDGWYKLTLREEHQDYISTYVDQGVKVVVLLVSGRPLVTTRQIEQADAFVAAWLPGSEGAAIADVLFGDYNFSGQLPHSWPKSTDDFNGKFGPNYWDNSIEPLFRLGYGLSY
jgi:beta-glucosidase